MADEPRARACCEKGPLCSWRSGTDVRTMERSRTSEPRGPVDYAFMQQTLTESPVDQAQG